MKGLESSPVKAADEPTMGTCSPERKLYLGLYPKKVGSAPLLQPVETPFGILHPALGSSAQERHKMGSQDSHKDDYRTG